MSRPVGRLITDDNAILRGIARFVKSVL
jgi:hypothetical protein